MKYKLQITNLRTLKLNDANKGMQEFFSELMDEVESCPFGTLLIDYEMSDVVGGLYSNQLAVDAITLPARDASYNKDMHTLTLTEDGIRTLIHEGSHFRHLVVDKGRFSSAKYKESAPITIDNVIAPKIRYAAEYEAAVRSVGTSIIYDIGNDEEVAADNLRNLLAYKTEAMSWQATISELYTKTENNIYKKLLIDFSLHVCKRYMIDKSFADVHDIDNVNIELTPHENVVLKFIESMLT